LQKEPQPIDVLINNAGVGWINERTLTEDGLETTMASNHFGHFLLTNLLLDRIKAAKQGRIVNVSSLAHWFIKKFDVNNLNSEKDYSKLKVYNVTKLANLLFTRQLAKRLEGTNVTVNALHPGAVTTGLYRHFAFYIRVFVWFGAQFMKTPVEGAQTTLYCAVAPELANTSGQYFADCKKAPISKVAQNDVFAQQLWDASERATGLKR